jgi:methionine-rich copper-binding protein CopC
MGLVFRLGFLFSALALAGAPDALARTLRPVESMPAAEAFVDGRNAQYSVRFDGPVDHRGSRLSILRDGQVVETLPVLLDSAPNVLFASAPQLAPGRYELRWSARSAPDGEVTAGSIAFTVRR